MNAKIPAVTSTVMPPMRTKEVKTLFLRELLSPAPNLIEKSTPLPMHSPMMMESRNVVRVYELPTAARASGPTKRPTMTVSAML